MRLVAGTTCTPWLLWVWTFNHFRSLPPTQGFVQSALANEPYRPLRGIGATASHAVVGNYGHSATGSGLPTATRSCAATPSGLATSSLFALSELDLANFRAPETAISQAFRMFREFSYGSGRARDLSNIPVYPRIRGHFAHLPVRKLAKVQLRLCLHLWQNTSR